MIKKYNRNNQNRKFYRTNDRIFARELRVLDSEGKQIGIISKEEALKNAQGQGLDLVEIAPMAKPPVAKIIDFKKFLYQEEKKKRDEKKNAKTSETKEVRLGPFMSQNDLLTMAKRAREFLTDGNKVRLVLTFNGRQITHPEFGHKVLDKTLEILSDISKVERDRKLEGRKLIVLISPEKKRSENSKEGDKQDEKVENQKVGI
ncbi:MAG TPA: translation initiation factor IF-3 [Candidatus Sulfotelmatobacter sp.]|nr:translation initiation factor IF-3 [Candidatus Sulfotelmatobacter sp.]